ncbi:MAG: AI-2E family transporter [Chloroflexi bacterium]|nr:AI-2E family transporter [Chloroflexota bacterium]MDA1241506.1 AI-2E family transporter [Chloroflexota bacterium]
MTNTPSDPPAAEDAPDPEIKRERARERPDLVGDGRLTPIILPRRVGYWVAAAAMLGLLLVLWVVPAVVTIAIGGIAFALLFSFPVRVLDRYMPRPAAVALVLSSFLGVLVLAFYLVIPPIAAEVSQFIEDLPDIIDDAESRVRSTAARLVEDGVLPADAEATITRLQQDLVARAGDSAGPLLTGILGRASGLVGLFITVFGVLFVGVTLLLDGDRLRRRVTLVFPERYHDDLDELWRDLGSSMSRYLGGLIAIAIIQGVVVTVALLVLGVPYAIVLGLWIALTSVIPYVGAWLGAIPAVILAALQSPSTAMWTVGIYFVVQTLEGNVLTPRVQGDAVRVHPIIVLLTVVAVGSLFGILGILLAVPMLAVGRVFFDFFYARVRFEDRELVH